MKILARDTCQHVISGSQRAVTDDKNDTIKKKEKEKKKKVFSVLVSKQVSLLFSIPQGLKNTRGTFSLFPLKANIKRSSIT
jgi:hypothetical protein